MFIRSSRLLVSLLALLAFAVVNVQGGGAPIGGARTAMAAGALKSDCKCNHGSCQAQCPEKVACFAGCATVLPPTEFVEFGDFAFRIARLDFTNLTADGLVAPPLFRPPRA